MNMQLSFDPINLSQSRHCKDKEVFPWLSQQLETSVFGSVQVNRQKKKWTSLKGNVHESLLDSTLKKLPWKKLKSFMIFLSRISFLS